MSVIFLLSIEIFRPPQVSLTNLSQNIFYTVSVRPASRIAVKLTVKSFLLLRLAIVLKQFVRFDFTQILVLFSLLH